METHVDSELVDTVRGERVGRMEKVAFIYIYMYIIYIHTHTYIYTYMYIYMHTIRCKMERWKAGEMFLCSTGNPI